VRGQQAGPPGWREGRGKHCRWFHGCSRATPSNDRNSVTLALIFGTERIEVLLLGLYRRCNNSKDFDLYERLRVKFH
jgi:hypothetical protein